MSAAHARIYRSLYRIRRVEEEIARVYPSDRIKSPVHLSIGQEAVSVGLCEALRAEDVVYGSYRSHALYLAKGGSLPAMIAELYGKATGCAGGKGGSMHLVDAAAGVLGASAVVGTTIPNAVGHALAVRLRREPRVVVSVFGDGAVDEGVFYESLNFAALRRLPMLFVCENNGYAIHTRQGERQRNPDVCARAEALGIPAERLDDMDVLRIAERSAEKVGRLRAGEGPFLLECATYRWKEHVGPGEDWHLGYRSREEAEPWIARDQVPRLGAELPADERAQIEREVEEEIAAAFAFAEASPFPAADELHTHVFHEGGR
jgi:TPP-dependent pyruvate/acetoin dehydrogenase alpha subunit